MLRILSASGWIKRISIFTTPLGVENFFSKWVNKKDFNFHHTIRYWDFFQQVAESKRFPFSPHHEMLRIFSASRWIKRISVFTTPLDIANIFSTSGGTIRLSAWRDFSFYHTIRCWESFFSTTGRINRLAAWRDFSFLRPLDIENLSLFFFLANGRIKKAFSMKGF